MNVLLLQSDKKVTQIKTVLSGHIRNNEMNNSFLNSFFSKRPIIL